MSKIEWTTRTWNPMVGCSKVSAGCQNCYAIKDAHRLAGNPNPKISGVYAGLTERRGDRTEWTGKVNFLPQRLELPIKTRKPTTWFVNSMSDLFHESVTDDQLDQIFAVMALTPQHTYQVLTKRPARMLDYLSAAEKRVFKSACGLADDKPELKSIPHQWPLPNVWLGVTVENQKAADRIPLLLQTPSAVRFLSCEPLLENVDLTRCGDSDYSIDSLTGAEPYGNSTRKGIVPRLDWVIVGGESGHGARPCHLPWIQDIVDQCAAAKVPCFTKQTGSNPWEHLVTGKGGDPQEWVNLGYNWPRQFPTLETKII